MTSRSDTAAAITPGSLEYGDRQKLVAGLQSVGTGGQPAAPNPAAGTLPPPVDGANDPLAALLGGQINPQGTDNPLTSGLSVGPGNGPDGVQNLQDPRKVRLQQIATKASSPMLRAAARLELRRLVGERV